MDYPPESWADSKLSSELPVLRAQGENQNLEFIREFPGNMREFAKEVAAFATSNPGLILIGVGDDGSLVGIDDVETAEARDNLVRRVEGVCRGPVKPTITPNVAFAIENSRVVLVVRVPKGPQPFYSCNNVPYVRHVREARPAEPHEIVELVRKWLRTSSEATESDAVSEHMTEVATVFTDLLVYGDEAERRDLNPLLDNLMSRFSLVADQLRRLANSDEAVSVGWQEDLQKLAERADRVGHYRHYLGSESWRTYLKLVQECVDSARELRSKHIDCSPYSAESSVWAARRLRELQRSLVSLAGRADDMIARGRPQELQAEASGLGLDLARLAYMGLDRQPMDVVNKLKMVAHDLHLSESPQLYRAGRIPLLAQRLKRASNEVQEVVDALT